MITRRPATIAMVACTVLVSMDTAAALSLSSTQMPSQLPSQRQPQMRMQMNTQSWSQASLAPRLSHSSFCNRNQAKACAWRPHGNNSDNNSGNNSGSRSSLNMHFGHSHSHHHHEHGHSQSHGHSQTDGHGGASAAAIKDPTAVARKRRFQAALVLFSALCTLGPAAVLRNRSLTSANWGAFVLTSTLLAAMGTIKASVKSGMDKMKLWRDGLVKHSPMQQQMHTHSHSHNHGQSATAAAAAATPSQQSSGNAMAAGNTDSNVWSRIFRTNNAADQVTWIGVFINLLLSAGKFAVGITCHSSALIADAGHSLSDLFSDFVTLYSVQIARLPPDDDHPYGHGKFEAIGSLFLALTLLGTGVSVGALANKELYSILQLQRGTAAATTTAAASKLLRVPKPPALLMAGLSILSKEWLFRITRKVGERINSQVVIANAWHHRSDAYSSVLALISIGFAIAVPSLVWADAAAGLLVAGMISLTGIEILGESIKQLSDSTNEELTHHVHKVLQESVNDPEDDVAAINRVRARQVGSSAIIDVQLATTKGLSGSAVRTVEERIKSKLFRRVSGLMDADVRAQPLMYDQELGADGKPLDDQTTAAGVICPLLLERDASSVPSSLEVQQIVTNQLASDDHVSVQNVVVNYHHTINIHVDVTLRLSPSQYITIAQAKRKTDDLKTMLESTSTIHSANIYLDMSSDDEVSNNITAANVQIKNGVKAPVAP